MSSRSLNVVDRKISTDSEVIAQDVYGRSLVKRNSFPFRVTSNVLIFLFKSLMLFGSGVWACSVTSERGIWGEEPQLATWSRSDNALRRIPRDIHSHAEWFAPEILLNVLWDPLFPKPRHSLSSKLLHISVSRIKFSQLIDCYIPVIGSNQLTTRWTSYKITFFLSSVRAWIIKGYRKTCRQISTSLNLDLAWSAMDGIEFTADFLCVC